MAAPDTSQQETYDLAFHGRAAFWERQQTERQTRLAQLYRECRQYRSILLGLPESEIPNESIDARPDNFVPLSFRELDQFEPKGSGDKGTELDLMMKNDRRSLRAMQGAVK
ncbi:MAG: hypothetical protein LQ352_001471, partial [Teloschistes flavicans]